MTAGQQRIVCLHDDARYYIATVHRQVGSHDGHVAVGRKQIPREVARPSLDKDVDKGAVYAMLASLAESTSEAVECLHKAQSAADAAGKSSAQYDLEEMMLHLRLGHGDEAARKLEHIQTRHGNEPGVRQTLMQLMYQAGLIGPDGRATGQAMAEPAMAGAGASPVDAGKLWTPGGAAPAGKKSALWVPGD